MADRPTGQAANQLMTWKSTSQLWCISLETVSPHLSWCLGQFSCFASLRHFGFDFFSPSGRSRQDQHYSWQLQLSPFHLIRLRKCFWVYSSLLDNLTAWDPKHAGAGTLVTTTCTRLHFRLYTEDEEDRWWPTVRCDKRLSVCQSASTPSDSKTDVNVEEIRGIQW